jgi:hypothetical protein
MPADSRRIAMSFHRYRWLDPRQPSRRFQIYAKNILKFALTFWESSKYIHRLAEGNRQLYAARWRRMK